MERRKFLGASALALGMFTLNSKSLTANYQNQGYNFQLLRNKIGVFTEQGGTIGWLNSSDGFIVVDAQFPSSAPHVISELRKLGSKSFTHLINTHHHGDHTAGNISFKGLVGNVVSHNNSQVNQMANAKKQGKENEQLYPDTIF